MFKKKLGREGEDFAKRFLRKKGYKILETNYRTPIGEIDIIARDGDVIVFVEVKTRSSLEFGYPHEAVTQSKQNRLKKLALYYLKSQKLTDVSVRFDVIGLYLKEGTYKVDHFVDAFEF